MKDAAQELVSRIQTAQASVKETGTFEVGKIPVDTGYLINSLTCAINGDSGAMGQDSYIFTIAKMNLGDTFTAAYTAEYAVQVEYGSAKMPGRFFVSNNVMEWQSIVDVSAAKFK